MFSEEKIQSDFYIAFHNKYPKYRGLLCYNLNNSKNRIDGARNKALGLQPGRSDMEFYWRGKTYFMEFKNDIGRQSSGQKEWQLLIESQGFYYGIFKSSECALDFIDKIISISLPIPN